MGSLFDDINKNKPLKVVQSSGKVDRKSLAGIDQLLLILPKRIPSELWQKIPQGKNLRALLRRATKGRVPIASTRLNNSRQTAIHVGQADAGAPVFESLTFARKMLAATGGEKAGVLGVWIAGFDDASECRLARHVVAAAAATQFRMPAYGAEKRPPPFRNLKLIGLGKRVDLDRTLAEAAGNNLARWLTAMPPNKLDASAYTEFLRTLARDRGWQYKKYGVRELEKMGAGAFLAVAQGNADDSAAIVRLRYRPGPGKPAPDLSLVGKGIIFDTGGTNLKPFTSMLDMHIDMGGSAVAVGTLETLSALRVDTAIDCWLAITENRTGPEAYKSQDVVTALNGTTIQTVHTDAEGRMVLADTLTLASRDKPAAIIDFATLTGACINAVTTRFSGVFTNRPSLHPALKRAGANCGERVWPFPIGDEYMEDLKSETADIMQCSPEAPGDHILAATFLNKFVENDVPWVHVDLSACKRKGGLGHIPTNITGFGVRLATYLVIDSKLIATADAA